MATILYWKALFICLGIVGLCSCFTSAFVGYGGCNGNNQLEGVRSRPSWTLHPIQRDFFHPTKGSFGRNSLIDNFHDPWFSQNPFWDNELANFPSEWLNRQSTLYKEHNEELVSEWMENQKEQWEREHQRRRLVWEEKEKLAKENYFRQLDRETLRASSQKSGKEVKNEVNIEIFGSNSVKNPQELMTMKISGYDKDDITVKTEGNIIHIHGKHHAGDCKKSNCIVKEFKKTFVLPEKVKANSVKAHFDKSGILKIEGNTKHSLNTEKTEPTGDRYSHINQASKNNDKSSKSHSPAGNGDNVKAKDTEVNSIGDKYYDEDVTIEVTD